MVRITSTMHIRHYSILFVIAKSVLQLARHIRHHNIIVFVIAKSVLQDRFASKK
jgi:hypothetical protein